MKWVIISLSKDDHWQKAKQITYLLISEGVLYFPCLRWVWNDKTCISISIPLSLINVCRCFARPVVPWKVRSKLRRWESRSGTEKLGGCIGVLLRRARSKGFISFFILGILRSVWNIAASRIIKILGVLLRRSSQEGFEKVSTRCHLLHKNLHHPLWIWTPPSKNWTGGWNTAVVARSLDSRRYEQELENELMLKTSWRAFNRKNLA